MLQLTAVAQHEGKSGWGLQQDPEAGTEVQAMQSAAYWLAPQGLLSLLSYTQNYLPAQGWHGTQ